VPPNWAAPSPFRLGAVSPQASAAFGATLILVALALVPFIWGCGEGVSGWNVLIFGLIAFGSSQLGAAVGRATRQRLVGIGMTIIAVLASLFLVGVITVGTC
jgi:hypothetical protein